MKTVALVMALFGATAAFADVDLSYAITSQIQEPLTGQRVKFDVRVANAGPDAATGVVVTITHSTVGSMFVELLAPAGWQCDFRPYSTGATCTAPSLASGAAVTFTPTVIMPGQAGAHVHIGGTVRSSSRDVNNSNNLGNVILAPVATPRQADLQISAAPELVAREGSDVRQRIEVRNAGPDQARDVAVVVYLIAFGITEDLALNASGAGWTCTAASGTHAYCTRRSLAAGASAPIDVQFRAPSTEGTVTMFMVPVAELNHDPTAGYVVTPVHVGSAESWRMFLVPLMNSGIAGANGSLWNTDLTMLVRGDAPVEIEPDRCEFGGIPECNMLPPPNQQAFDPRLYGVVWAFPENPAQFVYVRAEHFAKVSMNARIYDQSRQQQTAGAEIPVPRDTQFRSGTIALLDIPVAPQYRHTLRIYDQDGRDGTRVRIRFYANREQIPRAIVERTLSLPPFTAKLTSARLPAHPAFVQLDLGQLVPLDRLESMWLEIEPLDQGTKLWSFVSITNNHTHHVTTVTPQ